MNWKRTAFPAVAAGIILATSGCNSAAPAAVPATFRPAASAAAAARPPAHFDFRICAGTTGVYGIGHGSNPGTFKFVANDPNCATEYRGG